MINKCGNCTSYRKELKTCKKMEWIWKSGMERKFGVNKIPEKELIPYQLSENSRSCEKHDLWKEWNE